MATGYTNILKLALPVSGELVGTWGDTVNDEITQMVEQAVAGRAVIDTWSANSHTLTTANGATSESRCAIIYMSDTGNQLTGAGTCICPAASKIYVVTNATGETITFKTASGTGVAIADDATDVVFWDGTNVLSATPDTGISAVVDDTSPQLGGDLEVNGNDIVSASNGNIDIVPNGTGAINLTADNTAFGGGVTETVYSLSGTVLLPSNGTIQTKTLTGNTTLTDSLSAGQFITLLVDDGAAFTITWPTITWVTDSGTAPTLNTSGYTTIQLWKVGSTLYGARVGDA